jgi:hypothetical protein
MDFDNLVSQIRATEQYAFGFVDTRVFDGEFNEDRLALRVGEYLFPFDAEMRGCSVLSLCAFSGFTTDDRRLRPNP